MIPLTLQLKNFLSYGAEIQTIDFSTYPLICLSGKNGHGKSALLDAITWALWGAARKVTATAKADQGLLKLGQTQMMVSLDFEFNGNKYRVRREFAQTYGKPYAALDFAVFDAAQDTFIPLTDKTIRATQTKIDQTLHLDYESFINSAFLRQGQANEFSKKSPRDRKDILASILGLNQYEGIRKLALEKAKQAQTTKGNLLAIHERAEQELQKIPQLTTQLTELHQNLEQCAKQEQELADTKKKLNEHRLRHGKLQQEQEMIQFQCNELNTKDVELKKVLRATTSTWKQIHKKLLTSTNYEQLEAEKNNLITTIKEHQQTLQKNLEFKELYLKHKEQRQIKEQQLQQALQQKITQEQLTLERLTHETKSSQTKQEELAKQLDTLAKEQLSLMQEQNTLLKEIEKNKQLEQKTTIFEQQFEKRKNHYQSWITQGNIVKNNLDALLQKQELVHDDNNPSCPLCEQNLSASRRKFLKTQFTKDEQFLKNRFNRLSILIKKLKPLLIEQHAQLEQLKKQREQLQLQQARYDELGKTHEKQKLVLTVTQEQQQELNKLQTKLAADHAQQQIAVEQLLKNSVKEITENPEVIALNAAITTIEKQAGALAYNAQAHKTAAERMHTVEQQLTELALLMKERTLQENRKQEVAQLCLQLKALKKQHQELTKKLAQFAELTTKNNALAQQETALAQASHELAQHKEQLLQRKGSLEQEKQTLIKLEQEIKDQKTEITQLNNTIEDYQAIATATSKDGIQALLIEEAIPEIEQEANSLLARLTNNQAQLFIESLRDLKKGGTKETLDIKISDTAGIRPYELFSGGEAFRIDFALRIAISKLLARRAGTSLQTLIIDEGFGSQDEEGLGHIMDAIYKIQDDFAKVIIVSHLGTMKDQFPVHFVVEKGPQGSVINVMEQG